MEPLISGDLMQEFLDGAARSEVLFQRCGNCGTAQLPPSAVCHQCLSTAVRWEVSSGRANLLSYSTVHRAPSKEFAALVPYTVAMVQLDEGPLLQTWLVADGTEPTAEPSVSIGSPVDLSFRTINGKVVPVASAISSARDSFSTS